jgi:hypothetical protein
VGKIVFSGPDVKDGPALDWTSFEGTWRGFQRLGPVAAIYGNPVACSYSFVRHAFLVFLFFFFLVFSLLLLTCCSAAADPGLSECNYDQWDHSEFDGFLVTEMGLYDARYFQEIIKNATAANETVIIRMGPGGTSSNMPN